MTDARLSINGGAGALRHRRKKTTTYGQLRQFGTGRCGNVTSRMSAEGRGAS